MTAFSTTMHMIAMESTYSPSASARQRRDDQDDDEVVVELVPQQREEAGPRLLGQLVGAVLAAGAPAPELRLKPLSTSLSKAAATSSTGLPCASLASIQLASEKTPPVRVKVSLAKLGLPEGRGAGAALRDPVLTTYRGDFARNRPSYSPSKVQTRISGLRMRQTRRGFVTPRVRSPARRVRCTPPSWR